MKSAKGNELIKTTLGLELEGTFNDEELKELDNIIKGQLKNFAADYVELKLEKLNNTILEKINKKKDLEKEIEQIEIDLRLAMEIHNNLETNKKQMNKKPIIENKEAVVYFNPKVVENLKVPEGVEIVGNSLFYLNENTYLINASGYLHTNKYFTVLKGSKMSICCKGDTPEMVECHKKNHGKCIDRTLEKFGGAVINVEGKYYEFVEDFTFKNPRIAAELIKGYYGVKGYPWTDASGNSCTKAWENYSKAQKLKKAI